MTAPTLVDATIIDRVPDRDRDFGPATEDVAASPREAGVVQGIVRRPARDRREVVGEGELDPGMGLVGDDWLARGSRSTPDGRANLDAQLTLMSTRVLRAIEPDESRWALAGDQLLVDFDLSVDALPVGTRLGIGDAELVISEKPHTGCAKFSGRYGSDALRWLNSPAGRDLRLRGVYARVVRGGTIRVGDTIRRI
ncbi:MAG TPA: MOSC domain-containing protein [Candidatus Limnocylindrales bacterium]|nr:MOSC domain-containing protein [Candidatus Limnocylindrales bacterium]